MIAFGTVGIMTKKEEREQRIKNYHIYSDIPVEEIRNEVFYFFAPIFY